MQRMALVLAVAIGVTIGYVDSRPTWDDTGLTVAALATVSIALGAVSPTKPWVSALCVGIWVPAFGILLNANYGSLLGLAIAFGGAYIGLLMRRGLRPA